MDLTTVLNRVDVALIAVLFGALIVYAVGALGLITTLFRRTADHPVLRSMLGLKTPDAKVHRSAYGTVWDALFVVAGQGLATVILANSLKDRFTTGIIGGIAQFLAAGVVTVAIVRLTRPS